MAGRKKCPICKNPWCRCESRKFMAEVSHKFYGTTKGQVDESLKKFYAEGGNQLRGASIGSYPGSASENEFDKGVMKEIIDLFVVLRVDYNYTGGQIMEELKSLPERINEAAEDAYREISAEMAIERAKEERYCNGRKW